jgi:uncharacterized membrane protein YphA (DoxX/SURF4 family)
MTGGDPVEKGEGPVQIGKWTFTAAAAALGLTGLVSGAFADFWQPIPAGFPGYTPLAYLAGTMLLVGGLGIHFDLTARAAGWTLAIVFFCFSIPWAVRVVRFPQLFGTWGGFAEEFALVTAALILAGGADGRGVMDFRGLDRLCVLAFGLCAVAFGFNHFFALGQTAGMVPGWIPPGQMFWAVATGVFHVAAGIAILRGMKSLLAARLLGCMMLAFGAFVWLPNLAHSPQDHMVWAGNAVNLALAGSAFVVGDLLARTSGQPSKAVGPAHDAESTATSPAGLGTSP